MSSRITPGPKRAASQGADVTHPQLSWDHRSKGLSVVGATGHPIHCELSLGVPGLGNHSPRRRGVPVAIAGVWQRRKRGNGGRFSSTASRPRPRAMFRRPALRCTGCRSLAPRVLSRSMPTQSPAPDRSRTLGAHSRDALGAGVSFGVTCPDGRERKRARRRTRYPLEGQCTSLFTTISGFESRSGRRTRLQI